MIRYALTLVYLLFALASEPFVHAENALSAFPGEATSSSVSISNVVPRQDDRGQLMDQHDGNLLKVGDLWYWYGMGYTDCKLETGLIPPLDCPGIYRKFGKGCGFRTDHELNVYVSKDLATWSFAGDALPVNGTRPEGIYFRPKVIFNPKTSQYVLWINYLPPARTPLGSYPDATYLVGTSDKAEGPFEIVNESPNFQHTGPGDATLAVDEDGAAYVAYGAWGNGHRISIEKLTDDWLDTTGEETNTGFLSPEKREAPLLFERKGTWYLLYGHTCCFCRFGSGLTISTAPHPLGPWTETDVEINPRKKWSAHHEIPAQANYVFEVDGEFVYTGDLWTSAQDGLKSHDLQYWGVFDFDDTQQPPMIHEMVFKDEIVL
mmetsp:Transcript_5216/g.11036  ORF Transcript_5216/g.11036 Transcript_5216/m.11036 type:complete len:376 (+) Transcript_5216:70-1197(+)